MRRLLRAHGRGQFPLILATAILILPAVAGCSPQVLNLPVATPGQHSDPPAAQPEQTPEPPAVSLHEAAFAGDIDLVRRHIAAGTDLNAPDAFGSTPLVVAITFDKSEVARALIDAGADLTLVDVEGTTPLHLAALFGHTALVEALLDAGADRYARNNAGATAFDLVALPFEDDRWLYDQLSEGLAPLGLALDYAAIAQARPRIAGLLRPPPAELEAVDYTPLPGADWPVTTPTEQGLDPMLIAELYSDAAAAATLQALLVFKHDALIAERYFHDGAVDRKARLQSVTKSYTSALVGLALAEGCLSSVDQPMLDFFPELADQIDDARKADITIRHLLQMRAGYPWEESTQELFELLYTGFRPSILVAVPLVRDPGSGFAYSNLSSHLLGIIVARACAADLKSFAQAHLFGPLAVEAGDWIQDWEGYYNGHADLHLTARDAAKLGLLYRGDGKYAGKQVIPAAWVQESLQPYSEEIDGSSGVHAGRLSRYMRHVGYGYQWWTATAGGHDFAFAWGHGGQLIVVLDDLDMVVVAISDPMFGRHGGEAWQHEQATINLVAKFIASLPVE